MIHKNLFTKSLVWMVAAATVLTPATAMAAEADDTAAASEAPAEPASVEAPAAEAPAAAPAAAETPAAEPAAVETPVAETPVTTVDTEDEDADTEDAEYADEEDLEDEDIDEEDVDDEDLEDEDVDDEDVDDEDADYEDIDDEDADDEDADDEELAIDFDSWSEEDGARMHRDYGYDDGYYRLIAVTGDINENTGVNPDSEAYLTFSGWALYDVTTGDLTGVSSYDGVTDWNWAVNLVGTSAMPTDDAIFNDDGSYTTDAISWNIDKIFSKDELVYINGRYVYPVNLFSNGMASKITMTVGNDEDPFEIYLNKLVLSISDKDGQAYYVDVSDPEGTFCLDGCDAFGVVQAWDKTVLNKGVYEDEKVVQSTSKSAGSEATSDDDVPKTGESDMSGVFMLLLAGMFGGVYAVSRKVRRA